MHWSVQALLTGWPVFNDAATCDLLDQVGQEVLRGLDTMIGGWEARVRSIPVK